MMNRECGSISTQYGLLKREALNGLYTVRAHHLAMTCVIYILLYLATTSFHACNILVHWPSGLWVFQLVIVVGDSEFDGDIRWFSWIDVWLPV